MSTRHRYQTMKNDTQPCTELYFSILMVKLLWYWQSSQIVSMPCLFSLSCGSILYVVFLNSHLPRPVASTGPVFFFLFSYLQGTASAQNRVALRLHKSRFTSRCSPLYYLYTSLIATASRHNYFPNRLVLARGLFLCVSVQIKEAGFQAFDLNTHPQYWRL